MSSLLGKTHIFNHWPEAPPTTTMLLNRALTHWLAAVKGNINLSSTNRLNKMLSVH